MTNPNPNWTRTDHLRLHLTNAKGELLDTWVIPYGEFKDDQNVIRVVTDKIKDSLPWVYGDLQEYADA